MQKIFLKESNQHIFSKIENKKEYFNIVPQKNSHSKLGYIINNSELTFAFDTQFENIDLECYFLIPETNNQNVKLNILTNFKEKNTKIQINVIALAGDKANITLNGNLHIENNIRNVEAKLYEETLLLGNAKYISLIPGLRVDSPDVKASHGAKIQRISQDKIFYMQSRGLNYEKAIGIIIDSYYQQIIENLNLNEQEKSEFYSMIK